MQVHTFGHAPSRQIMVRASPDEPYHAVSPRSQSAGAPPAAPLRGVKQLPVVEPSPTQLVHYDKGSGMWVADPSGVEADSEGNQEPWGPTLGSALPSANSPGWSIHPLKRRSLGDGGCLTAFAVHVCVSSTSQSVCKADVALLMVPNTMTGSYIDWHTCCTARLSTEKESACPEHLTDRIFCGCAGRLERRAPSLADLGSDDIPKERRSLLQVSPVGLPNALRLPWFSGPYHTLRDAVVGTLGQFGCVSAPR